MNDSAGFIQAETPQLATTVRLNSLVKFSAEFLGRDFLSWAREALEQLKSKIGALGLRERKGGFEDLILGHAHGWIITGCRKRSKLVRLLCSALGVEGKEGHEEGVVGDGGVPVVGGEDGGV